MRDGSDAGDILPGFGSRERAPAGPVGFGEPADLDVPPAGQAYGGRGAARRLVRALSWVAVLTALVVLTGSGATYLYVDQQFGAIQRVGGLCLKDCKERPALVGRTENVLLVGSDSRAGANGKGENSGLVGQGTGGQRSDTTMLVHISADTAKAYVLSFPRDTLVKTPTLVVPQTGKTIGGGVNKFNQAYADGYDAGETIPGTPAQQDTYGGQLAARMVTQQVEDLTGLPVDHYAEIDFSGFQSMVDALGGVQVCLSVDAYDPGADGSGGSGFQHKAGHFTLDGQTALQFVRQRDGLDGGDIGRIGRQQRFLAALVRQVTSAGTLLNPVKLTRFVSAVTSHVTIDDATSKNDLLGLANRLKSLDPSRVQFITVPIAGDGGSPTDVHGQYLVLDRPRAQALFQAIHDDRDPNAPPPPPPAPSAAPLPARSGPPLTVPPAQAALQVENGSGQDGQATQASRDLQAVGFPAVAIAGTELVARTTIRFGSGRQESAQTLAAALPGATLEPSGALGPQGLLLLTGPDYTGAQPVTLGSSAPSSVPSSVPRAPATQPSSAAPAPSVSPSPNVAAVSAADAGCGP